MKTTSVTQCGDFSVQAQRKQGVRAGAVFAACHGAAVHRGVASPHAPAAFTSEFPHADQSPDQVIYYFHEPNSKWCVDLLINGNKIQFKLDTGADVNVLPRRYLQKIGMTSDSLMKSAVKLRGYSGGDIKVVGRCNIKVKYKDVNYILDFIIADVDSPPILGCQSCQELNLIKLTLAISKQSNDNFKEKILHEYKDVFEGLGCMPVQVESLRSDVIVNHLKNIFSRFGIPETVMSDNGPEFNSKEFRLFAREWNFKHITSSPRYPQSNGQVERTIQTIKNIMKKTRLDKTDFRLALLHYINTPISTTLPSPSELLFSRKLRTTIPYQPRLLRPVIYRNVRNNLVDRQLKQKYYYDKRAKDMCDLVVGQKVKVRFNKQWKSMWGHCSRLSRLVAE
ncbi:uncharacterized protein LOC123722901 [Papilio machaon]|uniref:uncharacterized protein LOC123722901 n=1 Tax=Papilio machaon TaxID=76193 RepID=UPI001E6654D6|nr:uncharacterized protein LOC123722901 [Papilio machaon]